MNIQLRYFEYGDEQDIVDIINDEDVQRYLNLSILPYETEDAENFIEYAKRNYISGGEQCFAITLDDKVIGSISYLLQSGCHACSASMGYYIGKKYWGRGIVPKAVDIIIEKIFDNPSICRIYAEIFAKNTASARVLEKCGFTYEGYLRNAITKNGEVFDAKLYSFVRDYLYR